MPSVTYPPDYILLFHNLETLHRNSTTYSIINPGKAKNGKEKTLHIKILAVSGKFSSFSKIKKLVT